MKINQFIEKYFWLFLIAGIIIGIWCPRSFKVPNYLPELLLGIMMFLVFLKIDAIEILEKVKDYKLMTLIVIIYMFIIPLIFFFLINSFNNELALGILLLTAMPAAVSSPALTDILKGNISLAMSIAIVTQLIAPFSVPFLFWLIGSKGLEISKLLIFKDIAIIVFLPMILSHIVKRHFPDAVNKSQHLFTSANIILLLAFIYFAISAQRNIIISHPVSLIWKTAILYLVFILLHTAGYLIYRKKNKKDKIALSVTSAYMNNGLAMVLASNYFGSGILILMVLSEIPWTTLLAPFKRITRYL
jgi:predicted Na+-dependent transporter